MKTSIKVVLVLIVLLAGVFVLERTGVIEIVPASRGEGPAEYQPASPPDDGRAEPAPSSRHERPARHALEGVVDAAVFARPIRVRPALPEAGMPAGTARFPGVAGSSGEKRPIMTSSCPEV